VLGFLRGVLGGNVFYPFEEMILEKVTSSMGGESGLRLTQQIAVINYVQRHREGREVNLYQMKNGKAGFDNDLRFPNATDEELLAHVILTSPPKKAELKADLWMAGGRIFSLEFDQEPKKFFSGTHLREARAEIAEVKICIDYS